MIGDGYRGAIRRAIATRGQNVADEQGSTAVGAEDAPAGVRVSEKEAAGHFLAGVAGVPVEVQAIVERNPLFAGR